MATVELRRLSFRHAQSDRVALRNIDLDVEPGLLVLAGGSGAGKSTLLRVLNGLVPHFHGGTISGSARVAGRDVFTTPTRVLARHVGFVFQDPEAQLVGGSVEREVAFGLENLGVPPAEMHTRVDEAMEATGCTDLRGRAVRSLSGGERQRVAIAAAVAMGGSVVALDEPTAQLDPAGAAAVIALVRARAATGTAVVIAEHRLDLLLEGAVTLAIVDDGRLDGPAPAGLLAASLPAAPQVVRLGVEAAWIPVPLAPRDIRGRISRLRELPEGAFTPRDEAWALTEVAAGPPGCPVLEGVTVSGGAAEVVVLMGPNGAGKTTLLRAIAGLARPGAGAVRRAPGRVAYLPQNPSAVLHAESVRAEVDLTLRRAAGGGRPGEADAILAELGIADLAERHPRDLSSGQRQRVALAALLCGRPAIALLDEPTRGMDHAARAALSTLVARLASEGTAVVLATHDTELAAEVGHRVVAVERGGVRELGPPRRALTGASPYATQLGGLLHRGPVTVREALALL